MGSLGKLSESIHVTRTWHRVTPNHCCHCPLERSSEPPPDRHQGHGARHHNRRPIHAPCSAVPLPRARPFALTRVCRRASDSCRASCTRRRARARPAEETPPRPVVPPAPRLLTTCQCVHSVSKQRKALFWGEGRASEVTRRCLRRFLWSRFGRWVPLASSG